MIFKTAKNLLVAFAIILSIGKANAGIITLQWNTTVAYSGFSDVKIDDSAKLVFRFEVMTNNLDNLTLDMSDLVDFSVYFDDSGNYATFQRPGGGNNSVRYNGNYFEFDASGNLSLKNDFDIVGTDVSQNISAGTSIQHGISDISHPVYCVNVCTPLVGKYIKLNDLAAGNKVINWHVSVSQVPEPSTLAIFALGIIGLASRRFKKQS
jgi:hypothetical protein